MSIRHSQSGFTLVELVIVIAIVSILVVVAVERFGDVASKATENSESYTISAVQSGVDLQNMKDYVDQSQ